MTERSQIKDIIDDYIRAVNANDLSDVPFSPGVVMTGPMIPVPIEGAQAVREHLQNVAPFVKHFALLELVIEGEKAAGVFDYESINGIRFQACQFFRFENGAIAEDRVFYDTAILMRGRT